MQTIRGQIIASTTRDAHGDKLTKEQLQDLFDQMPPVSLMNQEHDLSMPPIARSYNKQFVRLGDGEYAVVVDVDVVDEEAFAKCGGVSISYSVKTVRASGRTNPGHIRIDYNRLLFDEDMILAAVRLTDDAVQIDAVEVKQKAAITQTIILTIAFVSTAIASGFFSQIGADAYVRLKEWIRELAHRRRESREAPVLLHLVFPLALNAREVQVLVLIRAEDIDVVCRPRNAVAEVAAFLGESVNSDRARRIVVQPEAAAPFWSVVRVIEGEDLARV